MSAPPGATTTSCSTQSGDNMTSASLRNINTSGNCDVVLNVSVAFGISQDHAKSINFALGDNERIKANIGDFDLSLSDYFNGIPTRISSKASGVVVPLPENSTDDSVKMLMALGITKVNVGFDFDASWDKATQSINIGKVAVSGVDLGSFSLASVIGNAAEQLFDVDPNVQQAAGLNVTVKSITLDTKDDGLGDKLVPTLAQQQGVLRLGLELHLGVVDDLEQQRLVGLGAAHLQVDVGRLLGVLADELRGLVQRGDEGLVGLRVLGAEFLGRVQHGGRRGAAQHVVRIEHDARIGVAGELLFLEGRVAEVAGDLGATLVIEPGRLIVGNAGVLVTKVEYVKEGQKTFVIVDAAMNDLIRPTLYEAHHDVVPVQQSNLPQITADIVGPVCETGDYLALGRKMAGVTEGDLLAVMSAGAYGAVMASTYNTRALVPEVLVDGDRWHVIRPRRTIEDLIALDSVPDWL